MRVKIALLSLSVGLSLVSIAQAIQKPRFETDSLWISLKNQSHIENKIILLVLLDNASLSTDSFMTKTIFMDTSVQRKLNTHFIFQKIRLSGSQITDDEVLRLSSIGNQIKEQYAIKSYPAYLFFDSNGSAIHKDFGYKDKEGFLRLLTNASDSTKQYFKLKALFEQGHISLQQMRFLAFQSGNYNETDFANEVAGKYVHLYLDTINEDSFFLKSNLLFLQRFITVVRSYDRSFSLLYHNSRHADLVLSENGRTEKLIDMVITREEIEPSLTKYKNSKSDIRWHSLYRNIQKKYNAAYAQRNIIQAKVSWYARRKQFDLWAKYEITKVNKYGPGWLGLNGEAWSVFLYSDNRKALHAALGWVDEELRKKPDWPDALDTKANLLYKLGQKDQAIAIEEKAMQLHLQESLKQNRKPLDAFEKTLGKMKKGERTW